MIHNRLGLSIKHAACARIFRFNFDVSMKVAKTKIRRVCETEASTCPPALPTRRTRLSHKDYRRCCGACRKRMEPFGEWQSIGAIGIHRRFQGNQNDEHDQSNVFTMTPLVTKGHFCIDDLKKPAIISPCRMVSMNGVITFSSKSPLKSPQMLRRKPLQGY